MWVDIYDELRSRVPNIFSSFKTIGVDRGSSICLRHWPAVSKGWMAHTEPSVTEPTYVDNHAGRKTLIDLRKCGVP